MTSETVGAVKIMSYLEKKGKLKVVTTWKKYWFVLEGRLLLYYRSKEEYDNLSPCKGSINMGLAVNIRPGLATAGVFQIITRTNTVTLRAKERAIQEKWLQALLDASGQQTASNPIKMSHFRYSMDDLIPAGAKQQQRRSSLTRQNTLPNRFKNTKIDRNNSIIHRIRFIGGHTYGGSLDTINKLSKTKSRRLSTSEQEQLRNMTEKSSMDTGSDKEVENELYNGILVDNAGYVPANAEEVDHNKNCYIIENDQYIRGDDTFKNEEYSSTNSENSHQKPNDMEYYCTYEDINAIEGLRDQIYHEPVLPSKSEDRRSESDDCACGKEDKKESKFAKFTRRLRSMKDNENGLKKKSVNLILKLKGKKKHVDEASSEPIYDTVDYLEINRVKMEHEDNLVKTLMDLQQSLEVKKSKLKEIMVTQCNIIPHTSCESETTETKEKNEDSQIEDKIDNNSLPELEESCNPPGLPPRRGSKSRPRSPFHDIPKNNSPVKLTCPEQLPEITSMQDYSIDKILSDLELEAKKSDQQSEEMSVRQLIDKFNQVGSEDISTNEIEIDVSLRQKSESTSYGISEFDMIVLNRHSDDLNKLLEELTKVTCAPLLTPGVTSSLVQMRSQPLTDEEWLAIAPIRRRRHSEPDYDVPRSHRSLQILPRSPDKENGEEDTVIPATRFFGPVLSAITNDKALVDTSIPGRSMTPDSLEPIQFLQATLKQQKLDAKVTSNVENVKSVDDENLNETPLELPSSVHNKNIMNGTPQENPEQQSDGDFKHLSECLENMSIDLKPNDYLDSLEPYNEGATAF